MARVPNTASLRQLLEHAIRDDSDVEAFCIDYFPAVAKRFSQGMDRTQKLNILLVHEDGFYILESLYDRDPGRSATEVWIERIAWEDSLRDVNVIPITRRRKGRKRGLRNFVYGAVMADWARRLWNALSPMGRTVVLIVASILLSVFGITQLLNRYYYPSSRGRSAGTRLRHPPASEMIPPQMLAWPDGGAIVPLCCHDEVQYSNP